MVGCGKIAEKHLEAYRKLDGVEVTITDIVARGEALAERYEVGWHPVPDEVVASADFDAIDVCVPTPAHAQFIAAALRNDKHVFVEKPLAATLAEARAIAEQAAATDTVVMAGYLYRHHPAMQMVRNVIRTGVIGDPYLAMFRLGGRGSHKAWKHRAETGGGAANEMLVHMLDLALWYFGEPESASLMASDVLVPEREIDGELVSADAEDFLLLSLESAGGTRIVCESDLISPGYMNHIEVQGTNGSVMTSIIDYMPSFVYCKEPRGTYDRGHNFMQFPQADLFEVELARFLECIRCGDRTDVHSVEDSVRLMEIIDEVLAGSSSVRAA
jgi:predicted dehydrogenase